MAENTVFLLLTALIRNFYKFLMDRIDAKAFGLKKTSRIKVLAVHIPQFDSAYTRILLEDFLNVGHSKILARNPLKHTVTTFAPVN